MSFFCSCIEKLVITLTFQFTWNYIVFEYHIPYSKSSKAISSLCVRNRPKFKMLFTKKTLETLSFLRVVTVNYG